MMILLAFYIKCVN